MLFATKYDLFGGNCAFGNKHYMFAFDFNLTDFETEDALLGFVFHFFLLTVGSHISRHGGGVLVKGLIRSIFLIKTDQNLRQWRTISQAQRQLC